MSDDSDKKAERFAEELLKRIQSKEPRQKRNIFDYEIKQPHTLRKSMVSRAKEPLDKSIVCSTPARKSNKFSKIFGQVSPIRSQKSNEQSPNDIVTISSSNDTSKENGIKQKNQEKILSINKSPFIDPHKKILQSSSSENHTDKGINPQLQDKIISRSKSPFNHQHKKIVQTSSFENNTDKDINQQLQNEVISRTKSPFIDQHEKSIQTSLYENNTDKGINQLLQDENLSRTKSIIVKRKEETKIPVFKKSKLKKPHQRRSKSCSEQDYFNNSLKNSNSKNNSLRLNLNSYSSKIKESRGDNNNLSVENERDQIQLPSSKKSDKRKNKYPNIAQVNMLDQLNNDSCFNKYSDFMFVNRNTPKQPHPNSPQLNIHKDNINYMLDKHHSIPHTKISVDSDKDNGRMKDLALQTEDSYSHNSSDSVLLRGIINITSNAGTSSVPQNNTNNNTKVKYSSCRLFRSLSEGDIMESFSNDNNIIDYTKRPWRISGLPMDSTSNSISIKRCIANSFKYIDDDIVTDDESVLDEQSGQLTKTSMKSYKRKGLICDKNKNKVNTLFDSSSDTDTDGKNKTEKISRKCNKRKRNQSARRLYSSRDPLTEDTDTPTTNEVTRKNNRRHEKQIDYNKKSSKKDRINQVNSDKNEEHNLQINNQNTGGKKMTEEISRKCDKTKRTQPARELHSSHDSLIEETNKIFDKSSTIQNTIKSNGKSSRTDEIRRNHNGRFKRHASSDKESSKKKSISQVHSDKNEENNLLVTNNTSTVDSWLQVVNHSFEEQNSMHDNNNCLDIDTYSNETQNTEDINLRRRRSLRIVIDKLTSRLSQSSNCRESERSIESNKKSPTTDEITKKNNRRHEKQVDSNKKSSKKDSDKNEEHNLLETNIKNTDEKMTEEISSKCDERKKTQPDRELRSSHVSLTEDTNKQLDKYLTTRNIIKSPTTDKITKKNNRRHEKQVDSNKKSSKKNRINQYNSDKNEDHNLLETDNKNRDEKMTEDISSKCDKKKRTQPARELHSSHDSLTEDTNKILDNDNSSTRTDEIASKNNRRHESLVHSNQKSNKKDRINQVNSDENEEHNLLEDVDSLLEAINESLNDQNSILEEIDNCSNEAQNTEDINLHRRPSLRILIDQSTSQLVQNRNCQESDNSTTNLVEKKTHQKKINPPSVNVENHNSDKSINTVVNISPQMKTRNKTKNMKVNNLNTQNQIIDSITPKRLFNDNGSVDSCVAASVENSIPFDDEEINNRNIEINSSDQKKNVSNKTNVDADQFKEPPKKRVRGRKKAEPIENSIPCDGEEINNRNIEINSSGQKKNDSNKTNDAHQFKEPPKKRAPRRKKQSNNAECSVEAEKSSQQDENCSTRAGLQRSCRNRSRSSKKLDVVYLDQLSGFKHARTKFKPNMNSDVLSTSNEPKVANKKTKNTRKKRSALDSELPTIPESESSRKETDSEPSDDNIPGSSNNNRAYNDNFTLSTDDGILKDIDDETIRSKRRKRIVASTPANTVSQTLKYAHGTADEGVLFTNSRDREYISLRYIKVLPGKKKENHINNNFDLYFSHVQGIGKIIVNNQKYSVKDCTIVEVHQGATYSIKNSSDTCELILSCVIEKRRN